MIRACSIKEIKMTHNEYHAQQDAAEAAWEAGRLQRREEVENLAYKFLTNGHPDSPEWFIKAEKHLQAYFTISRNIDDRRCSLVEFTESMERQAENAARHELGYDEE